MKRLERQDWLDFALQELGQSGYGALKAQLLARRLGVTRGSFYWHFRDLDTFKADLIEYWTQQTTERLIASLAEGGDAFARLDTLLKRTFRSGEVLERAIRSWATVDSYVADLVAKVDDRRIDYAAQLLSEIGVAEAAVEPRARLLYWAAIGRLMLAKPAEQALDDRQIEGLSRLVSQQ